jgi:hypothetical protein
VLTGDEGVNSSFAIAPCSGQQVGGKAEHWVNYRSPSEIRRMRLECRPAVCHGELSCDTAMSRYGELNERPPKLACLSRSPSSHKAPCWRKPDSNLYGVFPVK